MADGMMLIINDNGEAEIYDDTYDLTIHCTSEEEKDEALRRLNSMRWIPCSERLPEELSVVNVTYVNHDPEPYYDFVKDIAFTETAVYYRGDWYWNWSGCVDVLGEYGRDDANKVDKAVEVIAWMPLPAPWKEGESNG